MYGEPAARIIENNLIRQASELCEADPYPVKFHTQTKGIALGVQPLRGSCTGPSDKVSVSCNE